MSSTRLQSAGFDAPTPTTVVSAADLEASAKPNIFNAITELPALQGSTGVSYNAGSTTTGLIGLSALGMRGLSPLRTLVLLDGQRVIGGNFNGAVDVSQMPQMLIQRVDVVTGGASASWGSDAVAGVINFITDRKFEGFKANAMAGLSTYGDMGNMTFQLAAGTTFMGGRAHFSMSAEYMYSDGSACPRDPVAQQHSAQARQHRRSADWPHLRHGVLRERRVHPGRPAPHQLLQHPCREHHELRLWRHPGRSEPTPSSPRKVRPSVSTWPATACAPARRRA